MKKLGLVLAGGGGKGSYQIGVWKYLHESGLDKNIAAFSGTSVGALNACLIMQGDYELAEHIWTREVSDKILAVNRDSIIKVFTKLGFIKFFPLSVLVAAAAALSSHGIFSRDGLLSIIDDYVDLSYISREQRALFATCFSISNFKPKYFKMNGCSDDRIKNILCSTSAIPVVFDIEKIDGEYYYDGGMPFIGNNVPIKPMYDIGCDAVIIVHLDRESIIDRAQFSNLKIYEICPQDDLGGLFTGTLDFSPSGAHARIEAGYNDTKKILEPVVEIAKIGKEHIESIKTMYIDEENYRIKHKMLLEERKKIKLNISFIDNLNIDYQNKLFIEDKKDD